jgi:predicted dehydrogenase
VKSAAFVPLAAVKGSAANSAVSVALIGSGGRGTFDAGLVTKHIPQARITVLCDVFDDRLERAAQRIPAPTAKTSKNYREVLNDPSVDAVIIATPVYLHPEHFEAAVAAKKHIYIEKPAGLDVAGCRRVIHAADSADRKLNIAFGFQQRYGQVYKKAKALQDSGALGNIRMAHSHWIKGVNVSSKPHPKPQTEEQKIRDWHVWRDTFGDIIVETYCHGIDVLNWFLGDHPLKAYGTGGATVDRRGDLMDHCDVAFTYKNDVMAMLTGSQITPVHYRSVNETFYGDRAAIETAREYWIHFRGPKDTVREESPREITIDALEEFVRRIQDGKPENMGVSGAYSTLTAIMGRTAIDQKREVTWDEMMKG